MSTQNRYESSFKQERFRFFIFATLAVLAPIMALLIPALKPNHIEIGDWFARSGAAMVVFALLAEANAVKVFNIFNPSSMVGEGFHEFRKTYWGWPSRLNKTAFTLIAIGTLIWGYGDLAF